MKTVAIVQARTTSTRLGGKVLKELPYGSGISVLEQVVRRLKAAQGVDAVVVATTTDAADEGLCSLAEKSGAGCYRGSRDDILARTYHAAKEAQAETIVRVTSDCPCIDPRVVDQAVEKHVAEKADFTSNILTRTMPRGLDTEVMSMTTLAEAHRSAKEPYDREHVCPYIYRTKPERFKLAEVHAPPELHSPDLRLTLDTLQDYALLCVVYDELYANDPYFGLGEIVALFRRKPYLQGISAAVDQKRPFDSLAEELDHAIRLLNLQELRRASEVLRRFKNERAGTD